jgi:hypothetical protein
MRPSPGRLSQEVVVGSTGLSFVERMNIYVCLRMLLSNLIEVEVELHKAIILKTPANVYSLYMYI